MIDTARKGGTIEFRDKKYLYYFSRVSRTSRPHPSRPASQPWGRVGSVKRRGSRSLSGLRVGLGLGPQIQDFRAAGFQDGWLGASRWHVHLKFGAGGLAPKTAYLLSSPLRVVDFFDCRRGHPSRVRNLKARAGSSRA